MHLAPIDWLIIVVYLVGCMLAGIWMRRYVRGVEDFAVAGRAMDLNLGIASLAATELGLVTVMYTAQMGYTHGLAGATAGVLMAAAMYFVGSTGFIIGPLRRAGVMTIPELFQKRFGTKVRWLAGLFVVLGGVLNMGIFLRLGGEFLVAATGMPADWLEWVMTALLGMILLYTVLGGMLSVLITDYLQFIVKGMGIVVTSILVICSLGWSDIVRGLWLCFDGSTAAGRTIANHPFNPVSSFGWVYCAWQVIFQLAAITTWQTVTARVLSARDEHTAKKMFRRTAFYFVGRFALPGLWGVAALIYFSNHGLPASLKALTPVQTSLQAMPTYLGILLPTGFIGLLMAAALAAEMSTDSGYLLTWATVIYNDLVTPCLKQPLSPARRLLLTRALVLAIGLFLLFYGLWYEIRGNAWDYLQVTGNIYLASVFTLLVAALYWPRANSIGAYTALVLGAIGPITFLIVNSGVAKQKPISPEIAGASSFALAFLGMIVGSLVSSEPAQKQTSQPEVAV